MGRKSVTTRARILAFEVSSRSGAPGRIRTYGLRIRSPALYPAELRARKAKNQKDFDELRTIARENAVVLPSDETSR